MSESLNLSAKKEQRKDRYYMFYFSLVLGSPNSTSLTLDRLSRQRNQFFVANGATSGHSSLQPAAAVFISSSSVFLKIITSEEKKHTYDQGCNEVYFRGVIIGSSLGDLLGHEGRVKEPATLIRVLPQQTLNCNKTSWFTFFNL